MENKKVIKFSLEEVSMILAKHVNKELNESIYTNLKVLHDDNGKIYFEFRY